MITNSYPQLPPLTFASIHPYNHHNHLHSLTAFPCTPHLHLCCSYFSLSLYITLGATELRHSQPEHSLLLESPSASMTPISEQQPKELEAQAATSQHDAPIRNEEAAIEDARNAEQEQQQEARRQRDFLAGIRKIIKSFKSLSHIFEIYKEDDDDEDEDMDMGIEIGLPTDVQHVTHIGLDGSTNMSSLRGLEGARELLSLSNLTTLEQFELAMASLAAPSKEHNGSAR
ncbi:uncharacterized protein LOC133900683 [Phragmites australis]|uniref:uncharacterized protein LOC133900683 n=1 Tax=Phragmites australis TaxID=29695 RepID=UPI002D78A56B|nr:uncharacterized protein LOC133900683 [Phragmites australis]